LGITSLRRECWNVNHKRVHRLYRLEGLQVRMRKRRRKRLSLHRGPAPRPTSLGERWSMDFVHDQLANGQAFRVLTVVDNWSRESVLLEAGFRLTGETVAKALLHASAQRPLPRSITVDHGTEFTSKALDQWAWENGVQLDFTRPGKPTDNGLCESFNGRLRDECLNVNEFVSIEHARHRIEAWRVDYNDHRPHGALGHLTPKQVRNEAPKRPISSSELSTNGGTSPARKVQFLLSTNWGSLRSGLPLSSRVRLLPLASVKAALMSRTDRPRAYISMAKRSSSSLRVPGASRIAERNGSTYRAPAAQRTRSDPRRRRACHADIHRDVHPTNRHARSSLVPQRPRLPLRAPLPIKRAARFTSSPQSASATRLSNSYSNRLRV
jgi:putative transposase